VLAVDTNVLVRLLVDDPDAPGQCAGARERVGREERVLVPYVALIETLWVLRESYGFSKAQVLEVFAKLLGNPRYRIANAEVIADALASFRRANVDFADCAIHAEARREAAALLTFDRKLRRLEGVEVIS
jgi:predicted nucleic-acid-binding protein